MVLGSEGSQCREPHDLRLRAAARGRPAAAPLPPDAKDAWAMELSHISAAGSRPSGKVLVWAGACTALGKVAARSWLLLAEQPVHLPPKYPHRPSNTRTQSKEHTEASDSLCPGNPGEDNAFPRSSTALPASHSQPHPTDAVEMPTFFLRGKQGRTNHLHRLSTIPGLRNQHPSQNSFVPHASEKC